MRMDEYIKRISELSEQDEKFEELRKGLPLGVDVSGNILLSQKRERPLSIRHTGVTGVGRTTYIRRLLISIACLYEKNEACFLVLSPKNEYGELLRLRSVDVTVPYIRSKADLALAVDTLKELIRQREYGGGYPHLFVVLDGLENLDGCNVNGDLAEYQEIFDLFHRRNDVDVISGSDLMKSIFSGYPGAFVGAGNCLVSLREEGKGDVTYVDEDGSLSLPMPIHYPSSPSITETVIFLNSLPKTE